ncbi:nucleotidyl transferase AbiEii/AbiGii toxin family protein [Candidatus Pacearchaeota archaeon]|nr:MAG: nucleotidyl transferase AbiEii/AbiGii toxin family protein [Candidatus Pacearchaeota archaeon]
MSLNIAKHKNILVKILKSIFSDPTISPLLGFKGGSAAMLFYELDRFSVDLDFDLLDVEKEDYVFNRVKTILENYGTVKKAEIKRFNLLFILSYDRKEKNAQNIKVEINRRSFGSKYNVQSYLGIPMKVMNREDMAAHKLVAMLERIGKTNRDIFDVYFFFEHDWPINKQIIENRMGMPYKRFLEKCIKALSQMDNRNILAGMGELLTEKQKNWVKTKLKTETLFLLRLALENEK